MGGVIVGMARDAVARRARDQAAVDAGLMRTVWDGRWGRSWERLRRQVLTESRVCGICGHDEANTVDHIISRADRPDLAEVRENLQPAHGVDRCPTCDRNCQNDKAAKRADETLVTTEDWLS